MTVFVAIVPRDGCAKGLVGWWWWDGERGGTEPRTPLRLWYGEEVGEKGLGRFAVGETRPPPPPAPGPEKASWRAARRGVVGCGDMGPGAPPRVWR